ncbi:MAG: hypothetical protein IJY93_06140 [Clostridia bacterium]|nr:hypothetical protein [Clostridia bacterium]
MFFSYNNENIRYTGRFGEVKKEGLPSSMTSTATGAQIEFNFIGDALQLEFDVSHSDFPRAHLYIEVDGGARIQTPVEKYIRVTAKNHGEHSIKIIVKSGVEYLDRWKLPLNSKVAFVGFNADGIAPIVPDERKTVEFIGDSITEGILVAEEYVYEDERFNRPWQDDATSTYAWLFAEAMNLRPYPMGYGSVGVTRGGNGGVPKAAEAYPYNFDGSPITYPSCDYIVINHGANDRIPGTNTPKPEYLPEYEGLLKLVRSRNPEAKIIVLSPFCGAMDDILPEFVESFNKDNNDSVYYISSHGWVPLEPLHPLRDGHKIIAKNLTEEFKKLGI